jgi:hypothetical protein
MMRPAIVLVALMLLVTSCSSSNSAHPAHRSLSRSLLVPSTDPTMCDASAVTYVVNGQVRDIGPAAKGVSGQLTVARGDQIHVLVKGNCSYAAHAGSLNARILPAMTDKATGHRRPRSFVANHPGRTQLMVSSGMCAKPRGVPVDTECLGGIGEVSDVWVTVVQAASATAAVEGANRALAAAEADRALRAIPVPPGSTRSASAPALRLRHLGADIGPVDPSLTRKNWWVVPKSYADLVAWYAARTHANLGSAYYGPGLTGLSPNGDIDWQIHDKSPAYLTPIAVVSYASLGANSTAIRTNATLAARSDRTADTRVPTTVASIEITKKAIDGPTTTPMTATVTDSATLDKALLAFNRLKGAYRQQSMGCGSPAGIVYVYAVTFHWPGHTLAVDPGEELCGIGRGLTLDGTTLPQALEDDKALDHALQEALNLS